VIVEQAIFDYLGQLQTILAFYDGRIYPLRIPPAPEFPLMTYQLASSPREGRSQTGPGLIRARYRLSAWGKTYDDTIEGCAVVTAVLEGGDPGGPIKRSTVEDERDWEPEVQSGLFRRMLEVQLWFDPAAV
jgi:hypothetical protein